MPRHRAHILLPDDLLREIDDIVGPRGRSAFLVETARNEVRRQKLMRFLESKDVAWERSGMGEGAAWVRKLRRESERRVSSPPAPGKRPATRQK